MRKHLSKWHRRLGIFAASITIYLSLTGLLLNHSDDLSLNETHISNTLLLQLYGIKPPTGLRASTKQFRADKLDKSLFLDENIIGQYDSTLIGAVALEQLFIIALNDSVLLLTPGGDLIETLTRSSGLPGQIDRLGRSESGLIIKSGKRLFQSDSDILNWVPLIDSEKRVLWSKLESIPTTTTVRLRAKLTSYGPSWERFLQDLHSGRFFKLLGTLLIDLTGVLLLLLSVSGIISFTIRRKSIRQNKQSRKAG
jgi:hypothetical protein